MSGHQGLLESFEAKRWTFVLVDVTTAQGLSSFKEGWSTQKGSFLFLKLIAR